MSHHGPSLQLRSYAVLLVVLVAISVPGGGMHASAVDEVTQIEPDTVLLDISITEDGTASWEVRYRVRLEDENTTAAFESLESDIRENRSAYAGRFESRIQRTVSAAENATGRTMAAENVSVHTDRQEIPQQYGLLVYTFEWHGFADIDGNSIRAGDAIGGLYLDDSTSLTINWPSGYTVEVLDPEADETGDRSATWRGPSEFTTDQPRVVLTPSATPTNNNSASGPSDDPASAVVPPTTLLAVAIMLAGLVGAVWWWRRNGRDDQVLKTDSNASTESPEPPEELLSNEERVLRVLRDHGGRVKQQQVVEALGWTDAKTSQVVGNLRELGKIEGFRLGRENVLRIPQDEEEEV